MSGILARIAGFAWFRLELALMLRTRLVEARVRGGQLLPHCGAVPAAAGSSLLGLQDVSQQMAQKPPAPCRAQLLSADCAPLEYMV